MSYSLKQMVEIAKGEQKCESIDIGAKGKDICVKRRTKLFDKNIAITLALMDFNDISSSGYAMADSTIEMEIVYFKRFLLLYTDVNNSEYYEITEEDLDALNQSGIYDRIMDICERDYNNLIKMFDNSIKIKLFGIVNGLFDNDANNKGVDSIESLLKTPGVLDNVLKVMELNDPSLVNVRDTVHSLTDIGGITVEDKSTK